MLEFADLLPNTNLLNILNIEPPSGYSKRHSNSLSSIINSPLNILSIKTMTESHADFNSVLKKMNDAYQRSRYTDNDERIFDMWLKLYNFTDESAMLNVLLDRNSELVVGGHFADLANYMFLTNRKTINHVEMEEWITVSPYIDIHKSQVPFNRLSGNDALSKSLNMMSTNYSISEVLNIMFMNYESQYNLFVQQDLNIGASLSSNVINTTVYQMLMIYYYQVVKEIKKSDPNSCLRLQEFMDYDTRQEFYSVVYRLSFFGNPDLYNSFESLEVADLYETLDGLIDKIQILITSDIPVSAWKDFVGLPNMWLNTLVKSDV